MNPNQKRVASFIRTHNLDAPTVYRILDLISEVGEVAKDAAESTNYGTAPQQLEITSTEVGDVMFSLLALADEADIDVDQALEDALDKYETRIGARDSPASENGES